MKINRIAELKVKKIVRINYIVLMQIVLLTFFVLIAFNIKSIVENDLYRYYEWSREYAQRPFVSLVKETRLDSKIVVALFWFAGKINCLGLIPAITVLVVYGIAFWIIYDTGKSLEIKQEIVYYLVFATSLMQFSSIASNVRNVMAFAILALASYRDLYKNKKNILTMFLYLLPCGLHITAVIFILARIFLPVYKKFRWYCVGVLIFIPPCVELLFSHSYLFKKFPFIKALIEKAHYYYFSFGETEWGRAVAQSGFEQSRKTVFFLVTVMLLLLSFCAVKKIRKIAPKYINAVLYAEISVLLTITSMYIPVPTYFRFSIIMLILYSITFFLVMKFHIQKRGLIPIMYAGYSIIVLYGLMSQLYHFYFNFRF